MAVRIVAAARDAELFARRFGVAGGAPTCWRAGAATATTRPSSTSSSVTGSAGWPRSATTRALRCSTPSRRRCGRSMPTLDTPLRAMADFADLKSPWFRGHSTGVAALAVAAGAAAGMSARRDDHRLGERRSSTTSARSASPAGSGTIPAGSAPSSGSGSGCTRTSASGSCAAAALLAPFADLAAGHHERADGSGYHRGIAEQDLAARGCSPRPTPTTR